MVDGSTDERRFVALYRRGDRLVGVLAMNRPGLLVTFRDLVERGAAWDEACAGPGGARVTGPSEVHRHCRPSMITMTAR